MNDCGKEKTDDEWKAELTDEQYRVARRGGTEMAFTGTYCNHKETASIAVSAAASRCSVRTRNTIPVRAGRVTGGRCKVMSRRN